MLSKSKTFSEGKTPIKKKSTQGNGAHSKPKRNNKAYRGQGK